MQCRRGEELGFLVFGQKMHLTQSKIFSQRMLYVNVGKLVLGAFELLPTLGSLQQGELNQHQD